MADKILLTMDDLEVAVTANAAFEAAGYDTVLVSALDDARATFRKAEPDALVLTGALDEQRAAHLIALARDRAVSTLGLIESAVPDPAKVGRRVGLTAWMAKPVDPREVVATASRLLDRRRLQQRTGIIGESPPIQEVLVKIEQVAPVTSTVLVEGESGTGKELVAHGIHALSPRRDRPFIAVNCGALPETLLESELFGHEKGAFTGAAERRLGRFELADTGTIFLDEVGAAPPSIQVKLLRVLESKVFFRVGGAQPIHVDVRVVAASNRSLKEAVGLGEFRDDLYYRLNVLNIYLPPLRERKSDVPILIRRFVREISELHGRPFHGIDQQAMEILINAHWPGNVRQLRNLIESMVVLAPGREVRASDIPEDIREGGTRLLPVQIPAATREVRGQELEFIFRSLVELKLQIEELRRRMEETPRRMQAIHVGQGADAAPAEYEDITPTRDAVAIPPLEAEAEEAHEPPPVLYRPGMTMADVERAAIEAALEETGANRRRAAEILGIGERTLYRKIKEYGLS